MAITNPQKLAEIVVSKWLVEQLPYKVQISRIWPFVGIDGYQLNVNQTPQFELDATADGIAYPLSDGANLTDQTSSPSTGSPAQFHLSELATDYSVTYTSQDRFTFPNDLDEAEAALAKQKLLYAYFWLLGQTNPTPTLASGLFKGLRDIVHSSQVIDITGAPLPTLTDFDKAYDLVSDNNGRPNAIMSNSAVRRAYLLACYTAGITPEYIDTTWTDPIEGEVTAPILALHGTPWYLNDLLANDTVDPFGGFCYFMVLGNQDGSGPGHGVTGIIPKEREGDMFVRRETNSGGGGNASLMHVDYTWPVGLAIGSSGALSILKGISIADVT